MFLLLFSSAVVARHFGMRKDPGWSVGPVRGGWLVAGVNPDRTGRGGASKAATACVADGMQYVLAYVI